MDKILFSIGIPAFKDVFLKKCIQSILNQTYTNFELIIVNDCSPQDLSSIVKKFDDERIKYFENEKNVGAKEVVKNWNKCLEHATGDFFVLMGDDDLMAKDYLYEFASLIQKHPDLDVYHCRTMIIDENDEPVKLTSSWPEYENVYDNIWHRLTERRSQYISDFVYRTEHLKKEKGFFYLPLAWGSDDISAYRASGTKGIAHTNKALFKYRSNSYSITSTGNLELKMHATKDYFIWLSEFLERTKPNSIGEVILYNHLNSNIIKYKKEKQNIFIRKAIRNKMFLRTLKLITKRKKIDIHIWQIIICFINVTTDVIKNKLIKSSL